MINHVFYVPLPPIHKHTIIECGALLVGNRLLNYTIFSATQKKGFLYWPFSILPVTCKQYNKNLLHGSDGGDFCIYSASKDEIDSLYYLQYQLICITSSKTSLVDMSTNDVFLLVKLRIIMHCVLTDSHLTPSCTTLLTSFPTQCVW